MFCHSIYEAIPIDQSGCDYSVNRGFAGFICEETPYTPNVAYLKMTRLDDRGYLFVQSKVLIENDTSVLYTRYTFNDVIINFEL